jgi:AcrR family transcriptional regulator
VPALPAQDRRAALIAATIPLLREHGASVSTRQIADAAGVAEGTIFGVFRDKASLLRAAAVAALDPAALLRRLREIDAALPLRARLVAAARLVREHVAGHGAIFLVVRGPLFGPHASRPAEANPEPAGRASEPGDERHSLADLMAWRYLVLYELATLIEPDARLLRRSPSTAARLLMSLVGSPPGAFGVLDERLDDEEVVSIVLDGLLMRPSDAAA